MIVRRLPIVLCVLVLAAAVSACGAAKNNVPGTAASESTGQDVADANNDGGYVTAGGITYQLEISRALNPYLPEDSQFVRGLPSGTSAALSADEMWYGVFLWAENQTKHPLTTSDNFEIQDSQDPPDIYRPVKLDTALNPFAWTALDLGPGATEPEVDSLMAQSPSQGGLVLFKVPTSVYDNRPLTLFILDANDKKIASISLNL